MQEWQQAVIIAKAREWVARHSRVLGVEDAEDCAADVIAAMLDAAAQGKELPALRSDLEARLVQDLNWRRIDLIRRRDRQRRRHAELANQLHVSIQTSDGLDDGHQAVLDLCEDSGLSSAQTAAIVAHYVYGLSTIDLEGRSGDSAAVWRQRLSRARSRLRAYLLALSDEG